LVVGSPGLDDGSLALACSTSGWWSRCSTTSGW